MKKDADFLEGAAQSVLSGLDPAKWKSKPFEMIFATLGPMFMWKFNWMLGILGFVGQYFGFGPGYIGKMIDEKLNIGGGKADLSDENLKSASESVIDEFIEKTKSFQRTSADDILDKIKISKGYIDKNDIIAAIYADDRKCIIKEARGGEAPSPGILKKIWTSITGSSSLTNTKLSLSGGLYSILKMFGKGILGAAAVAGVAHMFGAKGEQDKPQKQEQQKGIQRYTNVAKNVENTLIAFLDASIEGFSAEFNRQYKKQLAGSTELNNVLKEIETINNSSISNINNWEIFNGPTVLDIAYKILPMATYQKEEAPAEKPGQKLKPIGQKTEPIVKKPADRTELLKLLNEV